MTIYIYTTGEHFGTLFFLVRTREIEPPNQLLQRSFVDHVQQHLECALRVRTFGIPGMGTLYPVRANEVVVPPSLAPEIA